MEASVVQSATQKRYVARVFATTDLEGTTAIVYLCNGMPDDRQMKVIAKNEAAPATCFIHQTSGEQFDICFYNPTHAIKLCGHGLLASAKIIADVEHLASFQFHTLEDTIRGQYNSQSQCVEIAFQELPSTAATCPDWVSSCFNVSPIAVAMAGPNDGYWVMEWPQELSLEQLEVNSQQLIEHTERAVIATQRSNTPCYDYHFRYFAPQHGVVEDKATGSAHRVLISYWHQRLNKCNFKARQYSKEGAELIGRIVGGDVWISGNVDIHR